MNTMKWKAQCIDLRRTASPFQRFVGTIRKGNSHSFYAQWQQCLRELDARKEGYERARVDCAVYGVKERRARRWSTFTGWFRGIMPNVHALAMAREEAATLDLSAALDRKETLTEEGEWFSSMADDLKAELPLQDTKRMEKLDAEHWIVRIRQLIAIDMLSNGRPTQSTLDLAISLPPETLEMISSDFRMSEYLGLNQEQSAFVLSSLIPTHSGGERTDGSPVRKSD